MKKPISIASAGPARAAAAAASLAVDLEVLFHPVEHAILRKFFGMEPRPSDPEDLSQPEAQPGDEEMTPYIGVDPELQFHALENAVARLCLGAIQQRLPQWGAVHADGKVVLARDRYARSPRAIEPKPVHLFIINWADSGPGFSWPVAYHATWIPGYRRWVVTASADGDDSWGCTDIAVGSFRGSNILAGAGRVIRKEWRRARNEVSQGPWVDLLGSGVVTQDEAWSWRANVWRGHEDL
jgi:hypothetical protein